MWIYEIVYVRKKNMPHFHCVLIEYYTQFSTVREINFYQLKKLLSDVILAELQTNIFIN